MVTAYGMSAKLGQLSLERERRPAYLDGGALAVGAYSPETAREIDSEVRRMLDEQHTRVTSLLGKKTALLREAARVLIEKETLTGAELQAIADAVIKPAASAEKVPFAPRSVDADSGRFPDESRSV
jgi:cell division protease FtsH